MDRPSRSLLVLRAQGARAQIAEEVTEHLDEASIGGFHSFPADTIAEHVLRHVEWLLGRLEANPELTDPPTELAVLAATTGTPVESLGRFTRQVHRAIWDRLVDLAMTTDPASVLDLAQSLWEASDRLIAALETCYHQTRSAVRARHEESLDQLAIALLVSDGRDQLIAQRFCAYLNTTEVGSWLTAVGASQAQRMALENEAQRLTMQGYPAHCLDFDTLPILIAQLKSSSRAIPNDWLRTPTCGYAVAAELDRVPEALRVARRVAMALPATARGRWSIKDNWVRVAAVELHAAYGYLRDEVFPSTDALNDETREQLLSVLRAYLRTGSVRAASEECYLHRNTVLNRLRRLRDLTGLDATVPKDSALLLLIFGLSD